MRQPDAKDARQEASLAFAAALNTRGTVLYGLGRFEEAASCFRRAHRIRSDAGTTELAADSLVNKAACLERLGKAEESAAVHDEIMAALRKIRHAEPLAIEKLNASEKCFRLGQVKVAFRLLREALRRFRNRGNVSGQARALNNRGYFLSRLGRHEAALGWHNAAAQLFRKIGERTALASVLCSIAEDLVHLGRLNDAELKLSEAERAFGNCADAELRCRLLQARATISMRKSRFGNVDRTLKRASAIATTYGLRTETGLCLLLESELRLRRRNPAAAELLAKEAFELFGETSDRIHSTWAMLRQADALAAQGRHEAAARLRDSAGLILRLKARRPGRTR